MWTAFTILVGVGLVIYGVRGLRRKQIGFSIGPLLDIVLIAAPGMIFSVACVLGGAVLAIPLLIALVVGEPTDSLPLQVATNSGLPIVGVGFGLAIFIQMAIDLGRYLGKRKE